MNINTINAVILSVGQYSNSIYIIKCSHRIVVSTQDFHSCNTSSILVGSTNCYSFRKYGFNDVEITTAVLVDFA